jgi:hypothetical protein
MTARGKLETKPPLVVRHCGGGVAGEWSMALNPVLYCASVEAVQVLYRLFKHPILTPVIPLAVESISVVDESPGDTALADNLLVLRPFGRWTTVLA